MCLVILTPVSFVTLLMRFCLRACRKVLIDLWRPFVVCAQEPVLVTAHKQWNWLAHPWESQVAACFPLCPGSLAEGTQGAGHCSGECTLWVLRGGSEVTTTLVSIQRAWEREWLFPLCPLGPPLWILPAVSMTYGLFLKTWLLPPVLMAWLYSSISGFLQSQASGRIWAEV